MTPTVPDRLNFARHVLAHGRDDKVALAVVGASGAERWSYARLRAAVAATAGGLLASGLEPGDRVLIRLGNTVDFPLAHLAASWAGLIPVPTAASLTGAEVEAIAAALRPAVTLAGEGIAVPDGVRTIPAPVLKRMRGGTTVPAADTGANEPAYIVFTSGTSGRPRGVIHAHRAVWARRMMHDGWYDLGKRDRLMHAGAFNWTYTLGTGILDPLSVGATALVPQAGTEPSQLPLLMIRHGATIFAAAPGIYRRLLRGRARLDLPDLRHGLSAGEKLPEVTRAAWEAATGTAVHEAFGMTECSTFVSGSPSRPAPAGTSGYPQPGRRVSIRAGGGEAPRGSPGIISVHRSDPGLMLGYLGGGDEGHLDGDWFLTGDEGVMGPDGAIAYLGRADDMMNAGGIRVSPLEVERAFDGLVEACAAVERRVKSDASVIALCYEGAAHEAALRARADAVLAPYKRPRIYERRALPRGGNGKLNRKALR